MRTEGAGRYRGAILVALGLACGLAALAGGGFAGFVAALDRVEREPPMAADAIVALTGGSQRIGDAIDLLARGYGTRLLITGVNERTSRDEIAKLNAGQRELVACCVDLDYRARNTVGNAVETRRWMHENRFGSLIVVTSNYHMPRTIAELDRAMPGTRKVTHPVVTAAFDPDLWWMKPSSIRLLVGEYAKYVVAVARSRIAPPPAPEAGQVGERSAGG